MTQRVLVFRNKMGANKKGEMTTENVVELIIAIACLVVLFGIAVVMLVPGQDEVDKTRESYSEMLESAVGVADSGFVGDFFILDNKNEKVDFYLVYFGNDIECNGFIRHDKDSNVICVCSDEGGKKKCGGCVELGLPVKDFGECSRKGVLRLNIKKVEGFYEFSEIK